MHISLGALGDVYLLRLLPKKKKHLNVCLPLLLLPWLFHSAVGSLYLTTTMPKTIKNDETVDIVLTLFT